MRVWLVEDKSEGQASGLEGLLRQLEERAGGGLRLVGASPFQADLVASMRKLVPDLVNLLVVSERAWPEGPWLQEVLDLGMGMVIVSAADRAERLRALAETYPICFTPSPTVGGLDGLWLALITAFCDQRRVQHWKTQVTRLQQRLNDRIVIERAKGILVQQLKITEEDAYKRLRMLSRRQRRQIRDIAQSLLDTQLLLTPGSNGFVDLAEDEPEQRTKFPN